MFKVSPEGWDSSTGAWSPVKGFHADVYVFCLHTAITHDEYDPLGVSQWRFYVADRPAMEARAGAQLRLAAQGPVTYVDLPNSIVSLAASARE